MMKRIHRRVRPDQVNSALKSMTFDRKTFVECSQRMMRIVPTLGRPKSNPENEGSVSESTSARDDNVSAKETDLSAIPGKRTSLSLPPIGTRPFVSIEVENSDLDPDFSTDTDVDADCVPVGTRTNENASCAGSEGLKLPRTRTGSDNFTVEDSGKRHRKDLTKSAPITGVRFEAKPPGTVTLPAKLPVYRQKQNSGSIRKRLFKAFTQFASLMTTIGDNLEMAAYPTP